MSETSWSLPVDYGMFFIAPFDEPIDIVANNERELVALIASGGGAAIFTGVRMGVVTVAFDQRSGPEAEGGPAQGYTDRGEIALLGGKPLWCFSFDNSGAGKLPISEPVFVPDGTGRVGVVVRAAGREKYLGEYVESEEPVENYLITFVPELLTR